jgi:hypothetical protein
MSKNLNVIAVTVLSTVLFAEASWAQSCEGKSLRQAVRCIERKIDNLKTDLNNLTNGNTDVYIQNSLDPADQAYCIQNDRDGGTTFVHCNIPEPGQKLRIIKWPQSQ